MNIFRVMSILSISSTGVTLWNKGLIYIESLPSMDIVFVPLTHWLFARKQLGPHNLFWFIIYTKCARLLVFYWCVYTQMQQWTASAHERRESLSISICVCELQSELLDSELQQVEKQMIYFGDCFSIEFHFNHLLNRFSQPAAKSKLN